MISNEMGRWYEDYDVGETILHSLSKTITESDNNLFCLLTMNHHPIHLNSQYADQFGGILVVGTLVFSLTVGISVGDLSGKAIANLGYHDIKHLHPVRVGDTLYAYSEIIRKRESKTKQDRGIMTVRTIGKTSENAVISFERDILIQKHYGS